MALCPIATRSLSYNDLGPAGAAALAPGVAASAELTKIKYARPKLKLVDVTDSHKVPSLRSLGSNHLKDQGTTIVCNALKDSKISKLKELLMYDNDITVTGAESVAAYLAVTAELTSLE